MEGPVIHPTRPYADGILFDDLFDVRDPSLLISRGVVFATSFKANGRLYGGNIIAQSLPHAQIVAFGRGLGETVDGKLVHQETL